MKKIQNARGPNPKKIPPLRRTVFWSLRFGVWPFPGSSCDFWALIVFAFTILPVRAALKSDIEYGRVGDERLLLDSFVPDGEGSFPVAILVHGGGWSSGDKAGSEKPGSGNDITPWFAPLQAARFTYFSINYRHAPLHRWPACYEDVQSAIRWVKAHAAEYHGDPKRIALFGHSAGGQLVCLAATRATDETRIQAVVGFAPVTDFIADTVNRGGLSKSLQDLFNLPKEPNPDSLALLHANSPLTHVKPGLPPFLLVHGDADVTVPLSMSKTFQAQLHAAGVRCDLMVIPQAPHRLVGWEEFDPSYFDRVLLWLRSTLGPGSSLPGNNASSIRLDGKAEVGTTSAP